MWLFPDAPAGTIVDAVVQAEELGLDEFWLGDEGPARDPVALLAAAAVRTRRIRLAVGITNPYARHPALSATAMMTVHELSGGRAVLGLGPGGNIALRPLHIDRVRPLTEARRALRIIRATCRGEATDGYTPPAQAFTAPDLPVYIGARSERFNRFASEAADGSLVGGIPLPLTARVVEWNRSVRPIDVAVYPNGSFEPHRLEDIRPRMIFNVLDAPPDTPLRLGIDPAAMGDAAAALAGGDPGPAATLIDDGVLDSLLLRGRPEAVGAHLAAMVRELRPASIGLALLTEDIPATLDACAVTFAAMRRQLD